MLIVLGSLTRTVDEVSVYFFAVEEEGEDEDEEEENFSEQDEDEPKAKKPSPGPKSKTVASLPAKAKKVDLTKLPTLDNNGLLYLPKMQYFPLNQPCPLEPSNEVKGAALRALIHLPNGGFNCIAIPMEALDGESEKT